MTDPGALYETRVPASSERVLAAVGAAAEDWNGEWEPSGSGGTLQIPVSAGLRHGRQGGRLELVGEGEETAVRFRVEHAEYRVWAAAVVVLLFAAGGGVLTVLWPFFPQLLELAAFGIILALSGWFLVISRLHNRGPDEFLETVVLYAVEEAEGS